MLQNFTEEDVLQDILAKEAEADQAARDAAASQGFDLNDDAGSSRVPARMPQHPPGAGVTTKPPPPPARSTQAPSSAMTPNAWRSLAEPSSSPAYSSSPNQTQDCRLKPGWLVQGGQRE